MARYTTVLAGDEPYIVIKPGKIYLLNNHYVVVDTVQFAEREVGYSHALNRPEMERICHITTHRYTKPDVTAVRGWDYGADIGVYEHERVDNLTADQALRQLHMWTENGYVETRTWMERNGRPFDPHQIVQVN